MSGHGLDYIEVDDVSRTLAVFGFYVSVLGLASYTLKERLYMSDALIALLLGIAVGPIGWNLVSPWDWTNYNEETRNRLTYELARIVIGIQVLFTGIALPKAYLKHAWESLTTLLLLVMTAAWLISAAFIFALIPGLTFLESLCIAACVTPTDPVLANSVVKGRFAEKHIPPHIRNLIAAESGANDGLGFPFIYLAIYLLSRFVENRSVGNEIGWWIVDIWLYQIALSCAIGAVIGYIARKAVKYAEEKNMIDHESFLAIGIGLTFLTLGLTGMLGSDDILAAFVVGNSFTWDDYFRLRTEDESFQDVIDSLINTGIFLYIGALLPWSDFGNSEIGLSAWRLVVLGILIMLFRRLPWVMLLRKIIPDIVTWQEAAFTGWFGPIGVGAVYYAQVGLRRIPEDREHLRAVIVPVVYFIVLCSVVVHGITIPIFKHTPKIYSRTASMVRTRSGGQGFNDLSTKFKRMGNQTPNDGQNGNASAELVEQVQASQPVTRPGSSAGNDSSTVVGGGASTPRYENLVVASENRVKFADTHPAAEIGNASSGQEVREQDHARQQPAAGENKQEDHPKHGFFAGKHWSEIPRSDARGEVLSFDEGNVRVTGGADGNIHKEPMNATDQKQGNDLSVEEGDVGLSPEDRQNAREEMPDHMPEEEKMQAYKEKRMRRDVG